MALKILKRFFESWTTLETQRGREKYESTPLIKHNQSQLQKRQGREDLKLQEKGLKED